MARRARIEMMIIVPPVSKCEERNKDIVPTLVRTFKAARPEKMANCVDAVDSVMNEHSAYEEPPRQKLQAGGVQFGLYVLQGEANEKHQRGSS